MKTLNKKKDFELVLNNGKRIRSKIGLFYILPGKALEIGIITSKKLGNAVIRNKIRRRIREAIKRSPNFIRNDNKVILIPNKSAATLMFEDLINHINNIWPNYAKNRY